MEELEYGKRITEETIVAGIVKATGVKYSISRKTMDKAQALSEYMKALELISTKQTRKIEFTIEATPTYEFKRIVKTYLVDNE